MSERQVIVCPKCGGGRDSRILSCQTCPQIEERNARYRSQGKMPFSDGRWATEETSALPLTDAARKSLEHLKSEFDAKAAIYPGLEHALIEAEDRRKAFDAENYVAAMHCHPNEVRRIPCNLAGPELDGDEECAAFNADPIFGSAHFFIDSTPLRGLEAFREFVPLVRNVVDVLTDLRVLRSIRDENICAADAIIAENLVCRKWMLLIHRLAREPAPGGLLRSRSSSILSSPLPPGALAWTLSVGVFHASTLALERILAETMEKVKATGAVSALAGGRMPITSFGLLMRFIGEQETIRKQYNVPDGEWGQYPADVNLAIANLFCEIGNAHGTSELLRYLNTELGAYFNTGSLLEIRRRLAASQKLAFDEIDRLSISEVVNLLDSEAADTAAPPSKDESVATAPAPGSVTSEVTNPTAPPPPCRVIPRGKLDEHATIELTRNPSLTYDQLATMLGCSSKTLRDKRKCPLLAAAKAKIKAQWSEFLGGDKWSDRRADED
jgi:hypothetical protein